MGPSRQDNLERGNLRFSLAVQASRYRTTLGNEHASHASLVKLYCQLFRRDMSGNQTAQDGTLSSITGRSVYKSWHELVNQETGKAPANFSAVDTAKTGKISVEEWTVRFGSANGFERYDANHDGEIDQAEFLKAKTTMALAEIVRSAMGEGWAHIQINDISVKDTCGAGIGVFCFQPSYPRLSTDVVVLRAPCRFRIS